MDASQNVYTYIHVYTYINKNTSARSSQAYEEHTFNPLKRGLFSPSHKDTFLGSFTYMYAHVSEAVPMYILYKLFMRP